MKHKCQVCGAPIERVGRLTNPFTGIRKVLYRHTGPKWFVLDNDHEAVFRRSSVWL